MLELGIGLTTHPLKLPAKARTRLSKVPYETFSNPQFIYLVILHSFIMMNQSVQLAIY
ncbi:hypothetical protein CWI38_0033p0020 [Hamiltosporidium tvaerminnensis]|uniref:Uncharacterized protein n=1 Tax=Hamiltosporidium tvaerminnensis TaxID=1176355 RepID=A0A4Q9M1T6_9MICR|nr:hypothetical protein CWI38_0033p0020 [Hamiltosporidium tvaerminnensis]